MILGKFIKQPADVVDYDIDYSDWLSSGDTVASATSTVSPTGLTLGTIVVSSTSVKHWLSGGTSGVTYKVTVTAVTTGGRTVQHEFRVKVWDY